MNQTTLQFPGLGIGEFSMDKVAFTLFDKISVRWYGIILTLGIIIAFLYVIYRGKKNEGIDSDHVIDIGIVTVVLGVIGARAYYVLTDSGNTYDSFLDVIAIWNGGIAIYGAIIGGAIGIILMCAIKKVSLRKMLDMAAPAVILAQAVGRWGNFVNGEAHGYQIGGTTRFYLFSKEIVVNSGEGTFFNWIRMGIREYGQWIFYHPTFLYESVWNLVGFIWINAFYRHKKYDGQIVLLYLTWYGLGRTVIEGMRTDSLYFHGTDLRVSQCLGAACFAAGLAALIVCGIIAHKRKAEAAAQPQPVAAAEGNTAVVIEEKEESGFSVIIGNYFRKKKNAAPESTEEQPAEAEAEETEESAENAEEADNAEKDENQNAGAESASGDESTEAQNGIEN